MRARFDGNTVASRHVPQHRRRQPDDEHREPEAHAEQPQHAGDRQHAQPVGLATVAPRPRGFHADAKSAPPVAGAVRQRQELADRRHARVEHTCGWRRRSRRARRSRRSSARARLSRQRRTVVPRRRCRSRCRGRGGTTSAGRCRGSAGRGLASGIDAGAAWRSRGARASSAGVRGTGPTSARSDAHASPRRPVNSPTTSSATVSSTTSSSERSGSRAPPVSVATERMRWRARSRSWWRSGRRTLELLAVADAGLRGDDDAGAAEVGPPAQVDVVAVEARSAGRSRRARGTGRRARAGRPTAGRTRRGRRRAAPGRTRPAR